MKPNNLRDDLITRDKLAKLLIDYHDTPYRLRQSEALRLAGKIETEFGKELCVRVTDLLTQFCEKHCGYTSLSIYETICKP